MAFLCDVSEREDDVMITSVSLREDYGGWVRCLYPDCAEELDIEQLESHQLAHTDEEIARALQESEDRFVSDYHLALSLQNQETDFSPDIMLHKQSVTPTTQTDTLPPNRDVTLTTQTDRLPPNRDVTTNTHTANSVIKPAPAIGIGSTGGSIGKPGSVSQKRSNSTQSDYTYKPPKQAYKGSGSNIHTLSTVTSPARGRGKGEGGYQAQTEKKLEELAYKGAISSSDMYFKKLELKERLNSGRDDLDSCTEGAVESIRQSYSLFRPPWCFYLSLETPHFSYSYGDRGWGCGYRNIQMIIGSLLLSEKYRAVMNRSFSGSIPTVPRLQEMLDKAWQAGYDLQGAKDLGYKVRDTKTWIGTTEAAVLFRSFGVKAEVVDFLQPAGSDKSHNRLLKWVEHYFKRSTSGANETTDCPPLYLQHSGHSRTVIGWGQYKNNQYLTILDPMTHPDRLRKCVRLRERDLVWVLSRMSSHFVKPQYQIVYFNGLVESHRMEAYKVISPIERLTN